MHPNYRRYQNHRIQSYTTSHPHIPSNLALQNLCYFKYNQVKHSKILCSTHSLLTYFVQILVISGPVLINGMESASCWFTSLLVFIQPFNDLCSHMHMTGSGKEWTANLSRSKILQTFKNRCSGTPNALKWTQETLKMVLRRRIGRGRKVASVKKRK